MNEMTHLTTIANGLQTVQQHVMKAAKKYRSAAIPALVAVSKFHPSASIQQALDAGHRIFGENRVQEAEEKWPALKENYPDIELHLIGSLQSNKAKQALALFNVIEVIDRKKLVDAIAKELPKLKTTPRFYVQVNIGEEDQKSGVALDALPDLIDYCSKQQLPISGLMCIPPADQPPAPYFALLKKLADSYALPHISMGMSGDYEEAIRQGSTAVRVGTAIFGNRS